MKPRKAWLCIVASAVTAPAAQAGMIVLFDNMQGGWSPVLLGTSQTDILAIPFVVTQDCTLTQVLLPLSQPANRTYTHTVRLYASSSSDPSLPGSVLQEWSDVSVGLASLAPAAPVHLSAGSRYFLASFGNARSFVWDLGWHLNAAEERSALLYTYDNGGSWLVFEDMWMPALRVLGETSVPAVPEPATAALGALGLAAAMRRRRR